MIETHYKNAGKDKYWVHNEELFVFLGIVKISSFVCLLFFWLVFLARCFIIQTHPQTTGKEKDWVS